MQTARRLIYLNLAKALFFIPIVFGSASKSYGQQNGLEKFRLNKDSSAARSRSQITEFARVNNIPTEYNSAEGTHFSLAEIRNGKPVYRMTLNVDAATTTNVTGLRANAGLGFDLQGSGMTVAVFDDGLVKDHIELDTRVVSKEGTDEQYHATHVTGTLIATGINPAANGMAPKAKAATFYFGDDELKMAALAAPDQRSILLSNHSYGETTGWYKSNNAWKWTGDPAVSSDEDFRFGFYSERSRSLDELAFLAPYYSIVWAAGNDRADVGNGSRLADCNGGTGYDCIIPDAVAKNVITVGAVNKVLNYTSSSSVQMSFFSSWGPTDDGRIKPDVVGAGVNLFSLNSAGVNTYTTLSGTSMATPNVTGSLLLLQEWYSRLNGGNSMRASTLKALAIHTAREAGSFPGPDYSYGWGLVNATAATQLLRDEDDQQITVGEHELMNRQMFELELHPKANQKITATIAWTDPPGTPVENVLDPANLMLVNDLDLRITDEQGNKQFPWILDPLNPAKKASRGDNFRDNVEKIEFDLPLEKKYKLSVSHKGELAGGKQNFSIILTYTAVDAKSTTFYWIGDSGDWSDTSHWSLSSGGPPANKVPASADKVIVDENSFDGTGSDFLTITNDVTVASFVWVNNKPSGISFNDKSISVTRQMTLASDAFVSSGKGFFKFTNDGSESGQISIKKAQLPGVSCEAKGKWKFFGEAAFDELNVSYGNFFANSSILALKKFNSVGALAREIDLSGAQMAINEGSDLGGSNLSLHTNGCSLTLNGNTVLNWDGINFRGTILSASGVMRVNGDNQFDKVTVSADAEWSGTNRVDELIVKPGAQLLLGDGSELMLNSKAQLSGAESNPVKLSSNSKAYLSFSDHYKFCYDFLNIANVDVKNNSVNAGVNSSVSNSNNWQQKKCEEVLFADFNVKYNCANAIAEFTDTSEGSPDRWEWNFGNDNIQSARNAQFQFRTKGTYPVSLKVSKAGVEQTYSTPVTIVENPIPGNAIAVNNETLTSLELGDRYEWFRNGEALADANLRSYPYGGQEGLYFVVVFNDECNLPSDSVTITGSDVRNSRVDMYPNPATDYVTVTSPGEIGSVEITDLLGQRVYAKQANANSLNIDLRDISPAIYIVKVRSGHKEIRKRIVVKRDQ